MQGRNRECMLPYHFRSLAARENGCRLNLFTACEPSSKALTPSTCERDWDVTFLIYYLFKMRLL
jgi:hypothetical protein